VLIRSYAEDMHTKYTKAFSAFWISTTLAIGIAVPVTSAPGWAVLTSCALLPLLAIVFLSREPALSMSQSIQKALR
jgi:hypothetical protein